MWGFFYIFTLSYTYISNDVPQKNQLLNSSIFICNKLGKLKWLEYYNSEEG